MQDAPFKSAFHLCQLICKENRNSAAVHRNPTSAPQQATSGTTLPSSGIPNPLTQHKRALWIKWFLRRIRLFWSMPVPQHLSSLGGLRAGTIRGSAGREGAEPPPRGRQRGRPGEGRRVLPALLSNAAGPAARPGGTGGSGTSRAALAHRSPCSPPDRERHAVSAGRRSRPAPLTLAAALVLGHPRVPAGGVGGIRRARSSARTGGEQPAPRHRDAALEDGAAPARPGAAPSAVVLPRRRTRDRGARRGHGGRRLRCELWEGARPSPRLPFSLRSSLPLPATAGSRKQRRRRRRHSPGGRNAAPRRPVKLLLPSPASRRRHVPGAPRMPGSGTGGAGPPPRRPPSARRGGGGTGGGTSGGSARGCVTRRHPETPASPHGRHPRSPRHPPACLPARPPSPQPPAIPSNPRHHRAPSVSPDLRPEGAAPAERRRPGGFAVGGGGCARGAGPPCEGGENEPLAGVGVGELGVSSGRLEKAWGIGGRGLWGEAGGRRCRALRSHRGGAGTAGVHVVVSSALHCTCAGDHDICL